MTVACGAPLVDDLTGDHGRQHGVITSYVSPPLLGTVANFSCPPGLRLTGPSTATCMENGEWEPDPRKAECKGIECLTSKINVLRTMHYNTISL